MGNHVFLGHAVNYCQDGAAMLGCHESVKFEHTAKAVMNLHSIESWNAKSLVKENLRRQGELAHKSPLRNIRVQDGLDFIKERLNKEWFRGGGLQMFTCQPGVHISRDQFVDVCWEMMNKVKDDRQRNIQCSPKDKEELYEIFDSMDFDRSGVLSTGEWAGGCSVFFKGSTEECVKAVFNILDQDKSETLTMNELKEYLKPFLKAMMPEGAAALQPMLLKRATENIFQEMDKDHSNTIKAEEMLQWTQSGHNIIDSLAELIDREVYTLWMQNNKENQRRNFNSIGGGNQQGNQQYPNQQGPNQSDGSPMNGGWGNNNNMNSSMNGQMGQQGPGGPQQGMYDQQGQYGGGPQGGMYTNNGYPQGGGWGGSMQQGGGGCGGSPGGMQQGMQQGGWGGGGSPGGTQQGMQQGGAWGSGQGPPQQQQGGWGSPAGSQVQQNGWGQTPPGSQVNMGGCGGPQQQQGWGSQMGSQQGGYPAQGGGSPYGGGGAGYDPYGSPGRGSHEHFQSTASHWSNVPPPPPPPQRGAGPPRQDTSSSAYPGGGGGGYAYTGPSSQHMEQGGAGSSAPYQSSAPYGGGGGGYGGY